MKKLLLVICLMLTGCSNKGNIIICAPNGSLFYQYGTTAFDHSAKPLQNKFQNCINQPDGSIIIAPRTK